MGQFIFGFLDVSSILFYMSLLTSLSLLRAHLITSKFLIPSWAVISSFLVFSQLLFPRLQIIILIVFGIFVFLFEIFFVKTNWKIIKKAPLVISIVILLVAVLSLYLDYSKTYCDSQNHFFQFHAAWHLLSAFGMYFITNYLSQFKNLLSLPPPQSLKH